MNETISKPATNHREALLSMQELQQRRQEADREHAAEVARIKAETAQLEAIAHRFGEMHGERHLLLERIANAEAVYADQKAAASELDDAIDQLLGSPNVNGGRINFGPIFHGRRIEPLWNAGHAVELFERWFTRNRAKLASLESRMKAYATENNLVYALPISLGGEAVA